MTAFMRHALRARDALIAQLGPAIPVARLVTILGSGSVMR
jgi:hypothetical protein